jgi:outer membrane protein OmpU
MNKLTKIGASALCGSLAAIASANAGELTVTGGVDMSWISLDDETTGNPIGIGSNMGFTGSGELDNGWSVALGIYHANQSGYTETNVKVTVPSLGVFQIDQGSSGTGMDRYDDVTPNVWEEAYGTGLGTGINTVSGVAGAANIEWTPNMMPDGITAAIAVTPDAGGSKSNDKASSGDDGGFLGSGYDLIASMDGANFGMDGLTIKAGYSKIEQDSGSSTVDSDKDERTVAATYAMGNFTVGYQWSEEDLGLNTGVNLYENTGWGVTFSVNDDLSIGYNDYESEQNNHSGSHVTAEAKSFQIAYTMGGMSVRLAEASIDNAKYQTTAAFDRDATTLSMSLAF